MPTDPYIEGCESVVGGWRLQEPLGQHESTITFRGVNANGEAAAVKMMVADGWAVGAVPYIQFAARWLDDHHDRLRQVQHPHLARFLDWGRDGDDIFLVSELVAGTYFHEVPKWKVDDALPMLDQLLDAMCGMQQQGVAHQRLHNANLADTGGTTLKVLDWFCPPDPHLAVEKSLDMEARNQKRVGGIAASMLQPLFEDPADWTPRVREVRCLVDTLGKLTFAGGRAALRGAMAAPATWDEMPMADDLRPVIEQLQRPDRDYAYLLEVAFGQPKHPGRVLAAELLQHLASRGHPQAMAAFRRFAAVDQLELALRCADYLTLGRTKAGFSLLTDDDMPLLARAVASGTIQSSAASGLSVCLTLPESAKAAQQAVMDVLDEKVTPLTGTVAEAKRKVARLVLQTQWVEGYPLRVKAESVLTEGG